MPDAAPELLHLESLEKSFSGVPVLHGVTFQVHGGEVLGLVGENGSGKSTTMNIVAGVLQPDAGRMTLAGQAFQPQNRRAAEISGIGFIQQELNVFPNLSVAENLFLGRVPRFAKSLPLISRRRMGEEAHRWLEMVDLKIDPGMASAALTAGERQLLEIARALSTDASVMIFDEPTSSLTSRETERLFQIIDRLRSRNIGVIYTSHALEDVLRLSDRIVTMRDGRVAFQATRRDITADKLMTAMVGRSIDALFPEKKPLLPSAPNVIEVEKISEPGIVDDLTFSVRKGEIVGITGLMGAGRTELARILFGLDTYSAGTIRVNGHVLPSGNIAARLSAGMAFLTEDRRQEGAMMNASVADNFTLAALPHYARFGDGLLRSHTMMDRVAAIARALHLKSGPLKTTPMRSLSGGNQQKVLLGRWLMREPALFILDEPTRGIDIGAKQEIYRLLVAMAESGTAIILISSEMEEVMGLADHILIMHRGRIAARLDRTEFDRDRLLRAAFGQEQAA